MDHPNCDECGTETLYDPLEDRFLCQQCDHILPLPRQIKLQHASDGREEIIPKAEAFSRWPWLSDHSKAMDKGIHVFAEEGIFSCAG